MEKKLRLGISAFILFFNGLILSQTASALFDEASSTEAVVVRFVCSLLVGVSIALVTLWWFGNRLTWVAEKEIVESDEQKGWDFIIHLGISVFVCFAIHGAVMVGVNFGGMIIQLFDQIHFSEYAEDLIERIPDIE